MDTSKCSYDRIEATPTEVEGRDGKHDINKDMSWKFLIRQIFICSGTLTNCFSYGLSFGSPTVIIPQLRREANSTDAVSMETASWLSSTICYCGLVSSVILVCLAGLIGRKLTFVFVSASSLVGYVIFYYSKTTTHLFISEIVNGPLGACPLTITIMILTEYTTPRYRAVFLPLKAASFTWGIWVSNTIGTYYHWKNIGILGFVCMTYCLLSSFFWPESPYWLATKNRFEDCAESHRWLRGSGTDSETELEALLQTRNELNTVERNSQNKLRKIFKMLSSKKFYKPIFLSCLVLFMYYLSGKLACGMYAIDIIKRITKTESSAYNGMLILDGVTILGMYIGCGLSKFFERKYFLIITTTVGTVFLYCLSLYLYLINLKIMSEHVALSLLLLMGYSFSISIGPLILCTSIMGELIPIKYRKSAIVILSTTAHFLNGTILKITPFIIYYVDICGLFLFFALSETLFLILVYILLPETKDKTILEIQEMLLAKKLPDTTKANYKI